MIRRAGSQLFSLLEPFLGLLLVMGVFYLLDSSIRFGMADVRTISVQTVVTGIAAFGMTFIIISGGIDLSVGSAIALSSVVGALMIQADWPLPLAILASVVTGALCGLYNGLLITLLRLPPFIATLGTLGFFRGLAKKISGSTPVNADTLGMEAWVNPFPAEDSPFHWMVLAPGVWLMLLLAVLMAVILRFTVLGRHTFAIGSNEATARLCGLKVPSTKVKIYVLAGLLTGLAGILQFARLSQGDPTIAIGLELDVIAAVVIGGGSLTGGKGSILGTLAGAFMMAYLRNRCTAFGWPTYYQEMIVGHIIILAVAVDQWRNRRWSRS
ncbi:MAG: ABC transporter permease [Planctomycetota bacterium]|nr:MAG: ABC transporter permease [Planctomycetota bacterium]